MDKETVKQVADLALTVAKARNSLKELADKLNASKATPQEAKQYGKLRWAGYYLDYAVSYCNQALEAGE